MTLGAAAATVSGAEGTDILTGVERLVFDDISIFADGTNNRAITAADTATTTEDTPLTITASALLSNDLDVDGDALTISAVGGGVGGTASIGAGGDVIFTPRPYPVKAGRAPWGCKPWINWRYVMVGRAMARLRTKSPRSSIRRRRLKR